MTTEISKDGVAICKRYRLAIHHATGILPRVTIMSTPNRNDGKMDIFCTAEKQQHLAQKVMDAEGERIETTRLDNLAERTPEPWRRLKDYFTKDRLANNPLVQAEKDVLEANGYDLETDYYKAMDTPPGRGLLESVFFLFATADERVVMNKHLTAVRAIFSR